MNRPVGRRQVLGSGAFALTGLTAGTLSGIRDADAVAPATPSLPPGAMQVASFGWEVINLNGDGANVSFKVLRDMVLDAADIDVATMIFAPPATAGFQEVLCQAAVSRQAPPSFGSAPHAYVQQPATADAASWNVDNPNGAAVVGDSVLSQDKFVSIILKSWVPLDGTASSAARHVNTEPGLLLRSGDYLAFHMDHAGVSVDGEMQVVVNYHLAR